MFEQRKDVAAQQPLHIGNGIVTVEVADKEQIIAIAPLSDRGEVVFDDEFDPDLIVILPGIGIVFIEYTQDGFFGIVAFFRIEAFFKYPNFSTTFKSTHSVGEGLDPPKKRHGTAVREGQDPPLQWTD